jgi:radical SAM protein with 4Fe4S-binding SPASM domain
MLQEMAFRLDEGVELPPDTKVLHYRTDHAASDTGSCSGGCGSCSPSKSGIDVAQIVEGRFLAASPSVASYISLDNDLLPSFNSLLAGKTLRQIRDDLEVRFGPEGARDKLNLMLRNIVGRNFFAGAESEEAILKHPHMQIYVTNRCNLRCKHCYMSSGLPLPNEVGTTERMKAISIFAACCPGSKITFTGGEALLDPDIFELLAFARRSGLRTELYSNGLTIKDLSTALRIASSVDEVQVSIDGACAATNDEIRGKGTFNKIVRGIKLLDEARFIKSSNFKFRLALTLTSSNVEDVRKNIGSFVSSLELHVRPELRIGTVGKLGRVKENPQFIKDHDTLLMAQADIVNEFSRSGMHRMQITKVNRFTKTCGMGLSITIGADGAIYPCTITDQKSVGNITDDNAEAIIASVFDYSKATDVDHVEGCKSCHIRYFCGGICRITNLFKTGSMQISACTPDYKNSQIRNLIARYDSYGLSTERGAQNA